MPNSSTCTEWSITSSAGCSGLISPGSPPNAFIASRIAARSTTAGTPVKSCSSTRLGMNAISCDGTLLLFHPVSARIIVGLHGFAIFAAQQVLQQDAQRVRQMLDHAAMRLNGTQPVNLILFGTDTEGRATAEAVHE